MTPSFVMIDDFLANPLEMRRQALALGYDATTKDAGANFPGVTSARALHIPGLDETVSRVAGRALTGAPGTLHGHCRLTLRNDRGASGVHCDPAAWSGGTDFYRHRRTGLERVPATLDGIVAAGYPTGDALVADVINRDTLKPAAWERSFTAPMRFNRLILFSPWLFHNSAAGFGMGPQDGRLVYLMFFAPA
jgi:Family of unknown function (DUF6445)